MLSVSFAFVMATALFLLFKQTRWMGVVGVFVLLCISPLFFTGIALLVGTGFWLLFRRSLAGVASPAPRLLPGDTMAGSRRVLLLLLALAVVGVLAIGYSEPTGESAATKVLGAVRSAPRPEVIVLRTPGGLLEVSRIQATEVIDATIEHSLFGIRIGSTMPRIRVPAVYRYHIELEPEWRVVRADGVFTVVAPRVKPSLPVAVDFSGMEKDVAGTWILLPFTGNEDLDVLERGITAKLAEKAKSRDYLDRQREDARDTVREFARKWLVEQTRWRRADYEDIRVLFADEPAGAIAPLSG